MGKQLWLQRDPAIGTLISTGRIQIVFGGYVDTKKNFYSKQSLIEQYHRVTFFRDTFLDILTQDLPRISLLDLPINTSRLKKVGEHLKIVLNALQIINKSVSEEEIRKKKNQKNKMNKKKMAKEKDNLLKFENLIESMVKNVETYSKLLQYNATFVRHHLTKEENRVLFEALKIFG